MKIRRIRMHRIRLADGRELLLEEREAIALGDQLVNQALVGPANQRRLAFGDIALERTGSTLRPTLGSAATSTLSRGRKD